jgi:hypothetical protein
MPVILTPFLTIQNSWALVHPIIPFDQGETCKPVTFRMKPAFVSKAGAKRRHTPDPKQLRGTGLKVAEEQPHIPASTASNEALEPASGAEKALTKSWKPKSGAAPDGALIASPDNPELAKEPNPPPPKRKPRVRRAKISATKPDGSIPTTLGGKLPPVSVLARRQFGLRALRR